MKIGVVAHVERRTIVDKIIKELSKHAAIEEQIFYPVTRATIDDIDDDVLEALEEHHVVKWLLDELEHMDPTAERFKTKVTVLIENVRHHVKEEEGDYFPKVRAELGRNDLADLGEVMADAKKTAAKGPSTSTGRAAKTGAKRTASTAKGAAKKTVASAKRAAS